MLQKPMTAAEYAAHSERIKSESNPATEIYTTQKGSVFELRRINLTEMVQLGLIPTALVSETLKTLQSRGAYKPSETPALQIDTAIMKREVVQAACVMPPFNEQTAKSFLIEDFEEIYEWAIGHKGVLGAEALTKSSEGPERGIVRDSDNGSQVQPETVSTAAN